MYQPVKVGGRGHRASSVPSAGRPKKYKGGTLAVTFRVSPSLRKQGSAKAERDKINITKLMAMHYIDFIRRPSSEATLFMRRWEEENGPVEDYDGISR
jgi:hypothetical protein